MPSLECSAQTWAIECWNRSWKDRQRSLMTAGAFSSAAESKMTIRSLILGTLRQSRSGSSIDVIYVSGLNPLDQIVLAMKQVINGNDSEHQEEGASVASGHPLR